MTGQEGGAELPSRGDIKAASMRIAAWVRRTPVLDLGEGAFGLPGSYALKLELFQRSGSFKARGAFNVLLSGRCRMSAWPRRRAATSGWQ